MNGVVTRVHVAYISNMTGQSHPQSPVRVLVKIPFFKSSNVTTILI